MDTIFVLSTAPGKAGIAVIRITGSDAHKIVWALSGSIPQPRRASLRNLYSPDGEMLDQALILVFEGPNSFTGEHMAELQVHGSQAVTSSVMSAISSYPNVRLAEPGEFTRRALQNGRLDMTQVEGLADLIDSETEAQRRQAIRTMRGKLGEKTNRWRAKLIRAGALLEATIDFTDEEVPVDVMPEVGSLIEEVRADLSKEIIGISTAERIREGFEVAIVGAPNVGKSTLLNALAGREIAITSKVIGTTRDVIEARLDIEGLPVTFLDTAGLRETSDEVEAIGVARAKERAESADLRVFLIEPDASPGMEQQDEDIVLVSKIDMRSGVGNGISGITGQGVEGLTKSIGVLLSKRSQSVGVATRERHKLAMENAISALSQACELIAQNTAETDLIAEELRSSVRALDALIGRVDVEDVLDEIFSSFCLGK